jgi:3-methyl-2-oxobutanoate hydroxymethyltransferase
MNTLEFQKMKAEKQKISMITSYDYWTAKIINETDIDCILVGDSAAMVMHGHETTIPATVDMIATHTAAVVRGAPTKFVIADMPFLSFRKGLETAMQAVERFMHAGASAVKIEGVDGHEEIVKHITESGVPVMGHIGLTPQSIHQFGGFRVQGREEGAEERFVSQARRLEEAGCFSLVLECVPSQLAKTVSENLSIPTIGIGAGPDTDGQVLVFQDLLGMDSQFKPKFLKLYLDGFHLIQEAVNTFNREVKERVFPDEKGSYK